MTPGYQYDEEQQKYYLNARYYDARIARFISEDTYRGEPDDPLSLNLYAYCSNNPIIYTDPTGHFKEGEILEIGSYGEDVVMLQKQLNNALAGTTDAYGNPFQLEVTGIFDAATMLAVNQYKELNNLKNDSTDTYGKVGSTTWKNMQLGISGEQMSDKLTQQDAQFLLNLNESGLEDTYTAIKVLDHMKSTGGKITNEDLIALGVKDAVGGGFCKLFCRHNRNEL